MQEAVYRAAPKRLRADLHERYGDRLEEAHSELTELDEFVGHHLEQAYRLRSELGESELEGPSALRTTPAAAWVTPASVR